VKKIEKISNIISTIKYPNDHKFSTSLPNKRVNCEIALMETLKVISKNTKYEIFADELLELCSKEFEL
jgi:DNA primase large subunit